MILISGVTEKVVSCPVVSVPLDLSTYRGHNVLAGRNGRSLATPMGVGGKASLGACLSLALGLLFDQLCSWTLPVPGRNPHELFTVQERLVHPLRVKVNIIEGNDHCNHKLFIDTQIYCKVPIFTSVSFQLGFKVS